MSLSKGDKLTRYAATQIQCRRCGQLVMVGRRNALYCSGACRVAALRARRRPPPIPPGTLLRTMEIPTL